MPWGAKSLLTVSAESDGNPLNYSLIYKYEFVLWPHRISNLQKIIEELFPSDGVFCVLVFFGGFIGTGHTKNAQMRKCTNSCSRLIDLLNKI